MQISNRNNLTIAADDFGMNERANRNILFLVSMGKIDRVAVMTEGAFTEKELDELARSGVKLDIHLDLTSHTNSAEEVPCLFFRISGFLKDYLIGKYRTSQVSPQWEAQIEKFRGLFGKYPDGINSHEHVHFFPPFFKIITHLQEKYPIPYLRFGNRTILPNKSRISKLLSILRKIDLPRFQQSAFASSDHLISLDWIDNLDSFFNTLPMGTTEIVCHPHRAEEFVLIKDNF